MTRSGTLLLGLTAIIGGLAGLLAFALARFFDAARRIGKDARSAGGGAGADGLGDGGRARAAAGPGTGDGGPGGSL